MTHANIVIVDAYSTGAELARELTELGASCYHLCATRIPPPFVTKALNQNLYQEDLGYRGDPNRAANSIRSLKPAAVVPGCETGVVYAELVADRLGLPTNATDRVKARRDKYQMVDVVGRSGLHVASQALITSTAEAVTWATRYGNWPIVLKPLSSAGADGVTFCQNETELRLACQGVLGNRNVLGETNQKLVLQSFLDGPQFIVNTVTRKGRHFVTDAWRMNTRSLPGHAIVMEDLELLDPLIAPVPELIEYTLEAITALGITNGAAHTELKWTSQGPALIETGARIMGATMDHAAYHAAGLAHTQAGYYALDLVRPEVMDDIGSRMQHYRFGRHLAKMFFVFPAAGRIAGVGGLERLRELPSFYAHYDPLAVGSQVTQTINTLAKGGVVYLVHDDAEQLRRDKLAFRKLEADGALYAVSSSLSAA